MPPRPHHATTLTHQWYKPPPLVVDCLYNSVRSRLVAMITFAFVATAAATLLILSLREEETNYISMAYMMTPPSDAKFGLPLNNFSVRLATGASNSRPIVGATVKAVMFAMKPYTLLATLEPSEEQLVLRSVDCLGNYYGLDVEFKSQSKDLCDYDGKFISGATAVTDAEGIATFSHLIVAHGLPTSYLMTLTHSAIREPGDPNPTTLVHTLTMKAPPTISFLTRNLTWDQGDNENLKFHGEFTMEWELPFEEEDANPNAFINFVDENFRDRFRTRTTAPPVVTSAPTSPLSSSSSSLKKVYELPDYEWLQACVIPLDMHRENSTSLVGAQSRFPELSQVEKACFNVSRANMKLEENVVFVNISHSFEVSAASTNRVFLGMYFLGAILPLTAYPSNMDYYPHAIVAPIEWRTVISSIEMRILDASPSTVDPQAMSIKENKNYTLDLQIQVPPTFHQTPRQRRIYVFLRPAFRKSYAGYSTVRYPGWSPKILLHTEVVTSSSGHATLSLQVSLSGNVGSYILTVCCEGEYNSTLVHVESSVSAGDCDFQVSIAPWSTSNVTTAEFEETVGVPWKTQPRLRILDANAKPIMGKRVFVASQRADVDVSAESALSDKDGFVSFDSILVPNVPRSLFSTSFLRNTFLFLVDQMQIGQIEIKLLPPMQTTNVMSTCSVQTPTGTISSVVTGDRMQFSVSVVDTYGDRLENVRVELKTKDDLPVLMTFLSEEYLLNKILSPPSDRLGRIFMNLTRIGGIAWPQQVNFELRCVNKDIQFNAYVFSLTPMAPVSLVVVPFLSMVDAPTSQWTSTRTVRLTFPIEADWQLRPGKSFQLRLTQIRIPTIMHYIYDPPKVVSYAAAATGARSGTVVVRVDLEPHHEGTFLLAARVDGVTFFPASVFVLRKSPEIADISLVQSAGFLTTISPGVPVSTMPRVKMTDQQGNVVRDAIAYCVLYVDGGTGNYLVTPEDIEWGAIINSANSARNFAPTSSPSNFLGVASFLTLVLAGVMPGTPFTFVYGVGLTHFVVDTKVFLSQEAMSVNVDSAFSIPTVPGVPFSVTATVSPKQAYLGFTVVSTSEGSEMGKARMQTIFTYVAEVDPITGTFQIDKFALSPGVQDGNYKLMVLFPGGASEPFSVTATRKPNAIIVEVQPNADVMIGMVFKTSARVSTDGLPLPGVDVQISLSPLQPCALVECGNLGGTLFGMTDENGIVEFVVSITNGLEGQYRIKYTTSGVSNTFLAAAQSSILNLVAQITGTSSSSDLLAHFDIAVPNWVASLLAQLGQPPTAISMLLNHNQLSVDTEAIKLWNPVSAIEILAQPEVNADIATLPVVFSKMPVIRLTDRNGLPVANVSATVLVTSGTGLVLQVPSTSSGANGEIHYTSFKATEAAASSYKISFEVYGVMSPNTDDTKIQFTAAAPPSMSDQMQILSYVILALFLPLMIANIPHSSWHWLPISFLVLGGIAAMAIVEYKNLIGDSAAAGNNKWFVQSYVGLIVGLWGLAVLGIFALTVARIKSVVGGGKKGLGGGLNDESRFDHMFRYTQWLISARQPKGMNLAVHIAQENEEIKKSISFRLQEFVQNKLRLSFVEWEPLKTWYDTTELPPPEIPEDITPAFVPVKFFIVIAVVLVMLVVAIFYTISSVKKLEDFTDQLLAVLPQNPGQTASSSSSYGFLASAASVVNWALTVKDSLKELVAYVAANIPELVWLQPLLDPILSSDFLQYTSTFASYIQGMMSHVVTAIVIAHVVASIALLGAIGMIYRRIPGIIVDARRGKFTKLLREHQDDFSIESGNEYIGMHVVLFIVQHQIVFWVTFFVVQLLAAAWFRDFVWSHVELGVIITLCVTIGRGLIATTLVQIFVVKDMDMKRNFLYSIWSIVSCVTGIFTGLIAMLTRFFYAFTFMTILFPRVDLGILPYEYVVWDAGYTMFYSMIFSDAIYNNPVTLSFVSILIADVSLRRMVNNGGGKERGLLENNDDVEVDCTSFAPNCRLPIVANIVQRRMQFLIEDSRLYKRRTSPQTSNQKLALLNLEALASELIQPRYYKYTKKWWLFYILHQNPSVRMWRKHSLEKMSENVKLYLQESGDGQGGVVGGGKKGSPSSSGKDYFLQEEMIPRGQSATNVNTAAGHHPSQQLHEETDPFSQPFLSVPAPQQSPFDDEEEEHNVYASIGGKRKDPFKDVMDDL